MTVGKADILQGTLDLMVIEVALSLHRPSFAARRTGHR
jgi:hypothetical protein